MSHMTFLRVCLVLLLVVAFAGVVSAQTTGTLRGTIKDPSGAVVAGAKVTVTLAGTQNMRLATADENGNYLIVELPVGHYTFAVDAPGFKHFEITDVQIDLGHVVVENADLQLGAANQTVTVEAEAAQVETSSTQLGAVMNDTTIRQLPLNSRDTYQLLQLQPGVQSQLGSDLFYGSDQAGVVSVNGGRGRSNNYMVNGGDGNDIFVNLPAIQPSPDAIQEFRVITNTFDAEFGRNSGAVVNVVTKSGTNSIHGDFYDFFRNKALDSRNYFDAQTADWKQNQFGGTIGFPIIKDKTFMFASYEGDRLIQGKSSGAVFLPTGAEASGDFSAGGTFTGTLTDSFMASVLAARPGCSTAIMAEGGTAPAAGVVYASIFPHNKIPTACFDPTAVALYKQFVAPFGTGQISTNPVQRDQGNQFTLHLDHNLTSNQHLSGYYFFDDTNSDRPFSFFQAAGANLPGFGALFDTRVQQVNVSHTWTINSTSVNEFRFSYFREGQGNLNHPLNILSGGVHTSCGTFVSTQECFQDLNNQITPNSTGLGITTTIPGRQGVPYVNVSGGFAIGNNFEGELPQIGNTFQWMDNYTKVIGNHTMKFGADVHRQRFDQFLFFEIQGDYTIMSNAASPSSNDVGFSDAYPNYFLGMPTSYGQGAAQGEDVRNSEFFLFAEDSWKIRPTVTINYGLRWELNTPYYDLGNRLQTFRPGQADTQYPCLLQPNYTDGTPNPTSQALIGFYGSTDCSPTGPAAAIFPLGLVVPGDKGVPRGLTSTFYKSFAPRIGLAWSPGATEGWLAKLTGGPGKTSIRMGFGLFYNPMEQLVLEQFSAEPPFGGSAFSSNPLFNLPFEAQAGFSIPNVFRGVINQTPQTPCPTSGGPAGCVDWSNFRPLLLFGEFDPNLHAQYSDQYNFTIQRQIGRDMIFQIGYVGTQGHHLLASHDLDAGNAGTCLALHAIALANPNNLLTASPTNPLNPGAPTDCSNFGSDSSYFVQPGTVLPTNLPLPYNAGTGGRNIAAGTVVGPNGITLVGLRPYSSPLCQPLTGTNCPVDGVPVFSNIFAESTIANSNYNALQVSLERHFSKGLQFQMSYTFSKSIDDGSSFENQLNPVNFNVSRGLSLYDARHRFVISPYWELPIPKHDGFAGKLANGWAVSGIVTFQSGFPIRLYDANDAELASSFFFEPAGEPQITGGVHFMNAHQNTVPSCLQAPGVQPMQYLFNPCNFADSALGTYGNGPHALCCGPGISQTDISFQKSTPITEHLRTELRADIFNLWNHTQFENPDGNFSNLGSTFGVVTRARDPRLIQFGLKFFF